MPPREPAVTAHPGLTSSGEVWLVPHPGTGTGALTSLAVHATVDAAGRIDVEYQLRGELARLRLAPPALQPQRRDELWRHTCFELFARRGTEARYLEFNFSPGGDWAAWAFSDYRSGRRDLEQQQIGVATLADGTAGLRVRAHAGLDAAAAGTGAAGAHQRWSLNLAAVIETDAGALSYWAAQHAGAQPDFHQRASFCVALAAAPAELQALASRR